MQHECHRIPVTALACFKQDLILSGVGNYLHVYNAECGPEAKLKARVKVFESQAVHGIITIENSPTSTVLIWGGSCIRVLYLTDEIHIIAGGGLNVRDWILDAAFAPSGRGLAATVTAHNALSIVRINKTLHDQDGPPNIVLEHESSGSNCILYSAQISWLSASRILIASGTAFGGVVVWSATLEHGLCGVHHMTHYSFDAHEGSIFGVRLSSQLFLPGLEGKRLLASCSDDRTIRLWDISDLDDQDAAFSPARENAIMKSSSNLEPRRPVCISRVMGHISRIWHVQFRSRSADSGALEILTFGEDASVISWHLVKGKGLYALTQSRTTKAHAGKNIWAQTLHRVSGRFITGGADGAIVIHSDGLQDSSASEIAYTSSNELIYKDKLRAYTFVDPDTLISTTDLGRILLVNLAGFGSTFVEVSPPLSGLQGYSFVSSIGFTAFCGGTDGTVYGYSAVHQRLTELSQVGGKVAGLFACEISPDGVALLATSVSQHTAKLILMDRTQGCVAENENQLDLTLPAAFVTTSFTYTVAGAYKLAFVGSRQGSIAVYCYSSATPLHLSALHTEAHGKDAVTALRCLADSDNTPGHIQAWLYSVGRNGTLAVHALSFAGCDVRIELICQLSLPFGPNVEGLDIRQDGSIWTWGFQTKHFMVYDITAQETIMQVECGGAHRNWAFSPSNGGGRFVWTKASKVFHTFQSERPYQLLNTGSHGREIKAVSLTSFDEKTILATGAEDTDIKLFDLSKNGFDCLQTLRKHITGIQQLKWHGNYLFSSGGFEEFVIWKINANVPELKLGVVCESQHPNSGTSDLRIVGFDVQRSKIYEGFLITMAYSDSTLKQWRYYDRRWNLVASGDYLTSCLTHVTRMPNADGELLTTATDGYISHWSLDSSQETLRWCARHKVHQNAIHAIAHIPDFGDGTSLVITAGDDNAIGITRLGNSHSTTSRTLLVPRAHASAVTGLAIIPLVQQGSYVLASVSIDQRVKLWRVEVDAASSGVDGVTVRRLRNEFTSVADASSLEVCEMSGGRVGVVVCGVGIEMWSLNMDDLGR